MQDDRQGCVAVIFLSTRTGDDPQGYAAAADAMKRLASAQPGRRAVDAARGPDGVTVSYRADEASAPAWPEHAGIRDRGRALWDRSHRVDVARIERSHAWARP